MSVKIKGSNAERELIHLFWNNGWSACRVAGSGSTQFPAPDVMAGNGVRRLAIECKVTKAVRQQFSKKEVKELSEFSRIFGAEPIVGVKYNNVAWYFLTLEDLHETPKGYSVTIPQAKNRGLLFEELLKV